MKIETVRIQNFRALRDVTINFDSVTTFIGPNGVGKSTVLRALDWFFNRGKGQELVEDDYSFGTTDQDISVEVTFEQLSERDRVALGKYVTPEMQTFTAWKIHRPNGTELMSANTKGYSEFNAIKEARNATEKKELYKNLREGRPDLDLPAASSGPKVDECITTWESENLHLLEDVPEYLETNFFGFNSGGKMSGLFDFVLVTADLRASEEAADGKSSIVGRIIERTVDRSAADEEIAAIIEASKQRQEEVYREKFDGQLQRLSTQLNSVVNAYAPDREVEVSPISSEQKTPRTTFEITILDGSEETPIERQGHGFQRTLLISALQVLAESGEAGEQGVIYLAIEEPELFQHPIQATTFARVLRDLAEDSSKAMQIGYATHSPYFIEPQRFHQIRRLTRSEGEVVDVNVHHATVDDVVSRLDGIIKESVIRSQLDNTVANTLGLPVFSNKVLIVEGTTETATFYGLGDRDRPGKLESLGLAVAAANGKTNVPFLHAILELLGIPTYALFDGDADGPEKNRQQNVSENRKLLRYFGVAEADFPATSKYDKVAIFENNLESYLNQEWTGWEAECRTQAAVSNTALSKNHLLYRTATASAPGEPPEFLLEVIGQLTDSLEPTLFAT